MVRRTWLILLAGLLVLSLAANGWLGWSYAQGEAEVRHLREEREALYQRIAQLAEENRRLEQELAAYRAQEEAGRQLALLEQETSTLRELAPQREVERGFLSKEELRQYLERDFAEEYPPVEIDRDLRFLSLLELLDPQTDLYRLWLDLYTEQVIGFYDPDEGKLFIVGGSGLGSMARLTFVHEYAHALQDQHFDLGRRLDTISEDSDRELALMALAEGDASLTMEQYMQEHLRELLTLDLLVQSLLADTGKLNAAPAVIRVQMLFPYEQGLAFVTGFFLERGWAGVDAAWANPPQSTEQILHPERYPGDAPRLVTLPPLTATLGAGWRFQGEDSVGELLLRQHLAVRLDERQVEQAATGWDGGRYALYLRADRGEACLVLRLLWDDEAEAAEFVQHYRLYAAERYGAAGQGSPAEGMWWDGDPGLYLGQRGDAVVLVMAPGRDVVLAVSGAVHD